MKNIFNIFIALFLIISTLAQAQNPVARAGKHGIFIHFGKTIPRNFTYKLERKKQNENTWASIYTTDIKNMSREKMAARLQKAIAKNPFYSNPSDTTYGYFYEQFYKNVTADSLYSLAGQPIFLESAGLGFFDTNIEAKTNYEYRVSKMLNDSTKIDQNLIAALSFPKDKVNFCETKNIEKDANEDYIKLKYELRYQNPPMGFRVFRSIYTQTPFLEISPEHIYTFANGRAILNLKDEAVNSKNNYQYLVIPFDNYGNDGVSSDTITIANLKKNNEIPLLMRINAASIVKKNAIKLTWQYAQPLKNMRGINIYKSKYSDKDFVQIATVPANDTFYIDNVVVTNQAYFYYIVINSTHQDGYPSPTIGADLTPTKINNSKPQGMTLAKQTEHFLQLSWQNNLKYSRGFYVYRAEGLKGEMKQVSGLLTSKDSIQSYTDSSKQLRPNLVYGYALKSENQNYALSIASDTVYSQPITDINLPIPLNIYSVKEKTSAMIIWTNMLSFNRYITGYQVYRKEMGKQNQDFVLITKSPIASNQNSFIDSTLAQGIRYQYKVQSLSYNNAKSDMSQATEVYLPKILPPSPANIRISKQDEGIAIAWDKPLVDNISNYVIYRFEMGKNLEQISKTDGQTNGFIDAKASKNVKYLYQIATINNKGDESRLSQAVGVSEE